jgi:hypothetical protein
LFVFLMVAILTGGDFDWHFLYGQGCWAFLHVCLLGVVIHLDYFLCKKLCSVHLPISSLSHWFLLCSFLSSLNILVINPISDV